MKYTDEQLLNYLEGEGTPEERRAIDAWLASSKNARKRIEELTWITNTMEEAYSYDPSPMLDHELNSLLQSESAGTTPFRWWYAAAAVALMLVGFGFGRSMSSGQPSMPELTQLRTEVQSLQQLVMLNALKEHSASERIQAVGMIADSQSAPDPELIRTLLSTANADDSPNVRYAAIQALARFVDDEVVRQKLVRSLQVQTEPILQIALITVLVEAQERAAIHPLKQMIEDQQTSDDVRHHAQIALDILI